MSFPKRDEMGYVKEPVTIGQGISYLVSCVVAAVTAFGLQLDGPQVASIMLVTGAVVALVNAILVRNKVWPI